MDTSNTGSRGVLAHPEKKNLGLSLCLSLSIYICHTHTHTRTRSLSPLVSLFSLTHTHTHTPVLVVERRIPREEHGDVGARREGRVQRVELVEGVPIIRSGLT